MTTWILLRAAGMGAYVMLFLSVAWGLVATTSVVTKRVSKPSANLFHQFAATTGLALLGVHLGLLLIDAFMPFRVAGPHSCRCVDVPADRDHGRRASRCTPGGGHRCRRGCASRSARACWRRIHLLAVPAFTLALAHGVFAGTDTERSWMFAMYAVTGLIVVFLVLVAGFHLRLPTAAARPARARHPHHEDGCRADGGC